MFLLPLELQATKATLDKHLSAEKLKVFYRLVSLLKFAPTIKRTNEVVSNYMRLCMFSEIPISEYLTTILHFAAEL